jgi:hypothetical protein
MQAATVGSQADRGLGTAVGIAASRSTTLVAPEGAGGTAGSAGAFGAIAASRFGEGGTTACRK